MEEIHRVAVKNIVRYLAADLANNRDMNAAQRASLEKAITCLETCYGLDPAQRNEPDGIDLLDLVLRQERQKIIHRRG